MSILAIVEHSLSTGLSFIGSNLSNKKASAEQSCGRNQTINVCDTPQFQLCLKTQVTK